MKIFKETSVKLWISLTVLWLSYVFLVEWDDISRRDRVQWLISLPILSALALALFHWTFNKKKRDQNSNKTFFPKTFVKDLCAAADDLVIRMEGRLLSIADLNSDKTIDASAALNINFASVIKFNAELTAVQYALTLAHLTAAVRIKDYYGSKRTGAWYSAEQQTIMEHFMLKEPTHSGVIAEMMSELKDDGLMLSVDQAMHCEKTAKAIQALMTKNHEKPMSPLFSLLKTSGFEAHFERGNAYESVNEWIKEDLRYLNNSVSSAHK